MILARLVTTAFAAAAIGWTITVMPKFWLEATVDQAAAHIIAGESYKPGVMKALIVDLDHNRGSALRSSALSKAAIIRLRSVEDAITAGDQQFIDESLNTLGQSVNDALTNAPSDPYQWLVLFWLANTRNGFKLEHLRYLQMSYATGPNEGWIAIKRNPVALAIFPALSADLAEASITEFIGLVRSRLYTEASNIIAGPAWPIRHILLARLKDLTETDRRTFAKVLYERGLDDVPVPGIEPRPARPWR
jgi:hypothetical protein